MQEEKGKDGDGGERLPWHTQYQLNILKRNKQDFHLNSIFFLSMQQWLYGLGHKLAKKNVTTPTYGYNGNNESDNGDCKKKKKMYTVWRHT